MSNVNLLGSEEWAVVGIIDPDVTTASTVLTAAIDMSKFEQIMVTVLVGTLGASATLDVKLTEAILTGGAYGDISGKAITQLTQAGTDASDNQAIINLRGDEMTQGYQFIKVSLTVGTQTSDVALIVHGKAKSGPSSDSDLASVAEIVA